MAADIAFDVRGVCPFWGAAGAGTRANSLPAFPAVSALRFTARNPSDAVSRRLFRLDCGRLNVTRSSRNLSGIASRIVSANRTSGAGVRRRRICFFGSRWSSSAWSGPCQGVALSEEPLGHAGGESRWHGRLLKPGSGGGTVRHDRLFLSKNLLNLSNFVGAVRRRLFYPLRPSGTSPARAPVKAPERGRRRAERDV